MKRYLFLLLPLFFIYQNETFAQCADVYTDINTNSAVCGVYGDGSGNSNWNWEITDKMNPEYCTMWYARTSSISNKLTAMGSPFVDASTSALDLISQNQDFTRSKGWELLRRDFGCSHVTAYPYFILYNKYSGLMRIYVYQPETQPQYSGMLIQIEPTKNPWPATTSFGDQFVVAPDKYLSSNQGGSYGRMVIAVSEPAGGSRWSMAEFNPAFDPNIQNAAYTGSGLKMTIFGVQVFDMKATIKGRSVSTTDPNAYNFNYVPNLNPTTSDGGQTYSFSAAGEQFIKYSKNITEIRNKLNQNATDVYNALSGISIFEKSPLGKVKNTAFAVKNLTSSDQGLGQLLSNVSGFGTAAGLVLKFAGTLIGLFSESDAGTTPAPMPIYTNYDMVLNGNITAKNIQETFILRVPGTIQNDNSNALYYQCPEGIFNLKNTPQADTLVYRRLYEWQYFGETYVSQYRTNYTAYKIKNDITASFNGGAGLELVSAEGALVGEILPDANGNASYDLFKEHIRENPGTTTRHMYYNFMLPDLQNGRLQIIKYDVEKGLHRFQTPYVKLECLKGVSMDVQSPTQVYLRIKAVLKQTNNPSNVPIIYIKDYKIDYSQGSMPILQRANYDNYSGPNQLAPYANYTQLPTYISDVVLQNSSYTGTFEQKADNSISTQDAVVVMPSAQGVTFSTGADVVLKPGFEARYGCSFSANINIYGYNITCGTPQIDAFQYSGNCYNTTVTALRTRRPQTDLEIRIYPTLSSGKVFIYGPHLKKARITVIDESGRLVYDLKNRVENTSIEMDLNQVSNGIYFVRVLTGEKVITRKVVISH